MKIFLLILLVSLCSATPTTINAQLLTNLNQVVNSINAVADKPTDDYKVSLYTQLFKLIQRMDQKTLDSIKTYKQYQNSGLEIVSYLQIPDDQIISTDFAEMMTHLMEISREDMEWIGNETTALLINYPKLTFKVNKKVAIDFSKFAIEEIQANCYEYNYNTNKYNLRHRTFASLSGLYRNGRNFALFFEFLRKYDIDKNTNDWVDRNWSDWERMLPELKQMPKTKRIPLDK